MNEIRRPDTAPNANNGEDALRMTDTSLIVWDGLLGFLQRRKRTILTTTLAVAVLGMAVILLVPWSYKATSVVAINANPAIPENPQIHTPTPPSERMQREIQGLQSRALAARVIEKLKLERSPEFDPDLQGKGALDRLTASIAAVSQLFRSSDAPTPAEIEDLRRSGVVDVFMEKLTVAPILTADLIQVTFSSRDPRTAYTVANSIADTYIESATSTRGDALQKAADALQERISAVKDELRDLPVGAGGVNTIERQLEAKRTLLQAYIAKLGELLLLKAAIEPRIFIQSRAVYPLKRAGIQPALGLPLVIVAGLMLGIGLSVVQESRQKTITSATQLEALFGLRMIGASARADASMPRTERALTADPKRLEKACDRICMELLMAREPGRSTVVAFTAAAPSDAKSAICLGVARALARAEHRTLLIDASLSQSSARSKPAQAKRGAPLVPNPDPAFQADSAIHVRRDEASSLDVFATGLDRDSSAAEYEAVTKAVASFKETYGFIVLDLPPVSANPEARYLARFAELAVLVVRRDHDHKDAIRAAVDQLGANRVWIVGAVLTRGIFERGVFSWAADRLRLRA